MYIVFFGAYLIGFFKRSWSVFVIHVKIIEVLCTKIEKSALVHLLKLLAVSESTSQHFPQDEVVLYIPKIKLLCILETRLDLEYSTHPARIAHDKNRIEK